jgi:hypothetical protein
VYETLLKGLIRCGECGHRLTPKPSGKKYKDCNAYVYYVCKNVSKEGKAAGIKGSVKVSCRVGGGWRFRLGFFGRGSLVPVPQLVVAMLN